MSSLFNYAFTFTLKNEGVISDDKNDSGGLTKYGISKRSYPKLDIRSLTLEDAQKIYYADYWNPLFDALNDKELAVKLFDIGVNIGVHQAIKILQKCLNLYCKQDIIEDGWFGKGTLSACNKSKYLLTVFVFECSKYYEKISKRKSNKVFFIGWLNRVYKPINIINRG